MSHVTILRCRSMSIRQSGRVLNGNWLYVCWCFWRMDVAAWDPGCFFDPRTVGWPYPPYPVPWNKKPDGTYKKPDGTKPDHRCLKEVLALGYHRFCRFRLFCHGQIRPVRVRGWRLHQGLEPGVITYNATISACQKSDRWQEVGAINGGFHQWLYSNGYGWFMKWKIILKSYLNAWKLAQHHFRKPFHMFRIVSRFKGLDRLKEALFLVTESPGIGKRLMLCCCCIQCFHSHRPCNWCMMQKRSISKWTWSPTTQPSAHVTWCRK